MGLLGTWSQAILKKKVEIFILYIHFKLDKGGLEIQVP